MTSFTNTGEVAQAGYYSAESNLPNTITSDFTETPHSAMGRFTFPETTQADFLVKLMDSQNGDSATSATIVGNDEIQGSVTSGDFCGEGVNDGQVQQYTVYFDIVFDHPFTASQIITESGQTDPDSVFLTFDTTSNPVIQAKVGISYVSTANAKLNWQTENPGWNFGAVKSAAQADWNKLLGRIQVSGGSYRPDPGVLQPAVQGLHAAQHHQRRQRPVHGLGREGAHAGQRTGQPVRDLLRLGHLPLAGPAAGHAGSEGGQRHGAVAGQLLRRGRPPAAVGLPEPEQLRDGR